MTGIQNIAMSYPVMPAPAPAAIDNEATERAPDSEMIEAKAPLPAESGARIDILA